jgi:hypothetical protein
MTPIDNQKRLRRGSSVRVKAFTRRLVLIALPLLILPGAAAAYGPSRESCSRSGVMVTSSSDWRQRIERASPGTTIVMRGGTYRFSGTLQLPSGSSSSPILIKPYNCESVKLRPDGSGQALRAGSYVTLAGVDLETSTHANFLNISSGRNFVLRNSRLVGGRNDAFVIRGGERLSFEGNYINSGPARRTGTSGSSGGHIFYFRPKGSSRARDVRVEENQIEGSYFGDAAQGDDVFAVSAGDRVVIEHNLIKNQYNVENIVDIKISTSSSPVIFRNNTVTDNFKGSKGGQDKGRPEACVVIGDANSGTRLKHVITGNNFSGCPAGFFSVGGGSRSGSAQIKYNTFRDSSRSPTPGVIAKAINTEVTNNNFYGGAVKIGMGGCTQGSMPQRLVMRDNTFRGTTIYDQAAKCSARTSVYRDNRVYR